MTGKKLKVSLMIFIIAAIFFLMQGIVLAKTPQFRLDINRLNLEKDASANLVFSLVNAKGAEVVGIKGLENFEVISKGNSTSTQTINGDTTYEKDFNYVILQTSPCPFVFLESYKFPLFYFSNIFHLF